MSQIPTEVPNVRVPGADADAAFLAALGRRVRGARERRGISRKTLSQEAGVSERYLAQLETGDANASVLLLRNVARALHLGLTELLGEREASAEHRLIRRFLGELPAHRLEDVVFKLMREFGPAESARRTRVALIGLRGAGKTTLGKALAAWLGTRFVELDVEIERDAGMSLAEIFMLYGQAGFRRIERSCLDKLLRAREPLVLAVGGGIVSQSETYNLLLQHCFTVWIKATPEQHMARVLAQGDLRPMQGSAEAMDDLRRILEAREPLYAKADATLDTAGDTVDNSLARLARITAPERHDRH
ncbi:MAG: helix-turn-helix transcriptional regulator [Casimicrobiaceae bacterium]